MIVDFVMADFVMVELASLALPVGVGLCALVGAMNTERIRRPIGEPRPIVGVVDAHMPVRVQAMFDRAGVGQRLPDVLLGLGAVLVLAAGLSALSGSWGPLLTAVLLVGAGLGLALTVFRHRRDRLIVASLPAALEAMARAVRSGATFTQGVLETSHAVSGPLQREFAELHRRLTLGQGFAVVVHDWAARRPLPAVRLACAALEFSHDAGGVRSRAIDGVADSLRDHAALDAEIAALASQARMSALVVAALPIGFVALSSTIDSGVAAFLFGSSLGLGCLAGGIMLDLIGFVWMRRMTAVLS